MALYSKLIDSDVPEDPYLSKELQRYFPKPLQKKYAQAMEQHRLKREIIATAVTNTMINRMGATFLLRKLLDNALGVGAFADVLDKGGRHLIAQRLERRVARLHAQVVGVCQVGC